MPRELKLIARRSPNDLEVRVTTARPPVDPDTQSGDQSDAATSPPLPHERDESTDAAKGPPRRVMRRAAEDLEEGQLDTDRRGDATETFNRSKPAR
ncbi:MAG: hypothetical protein ACKVQU_00030 [Burkholderiales bacterium]